MNHFSQLSEFIAALVNDFFNFDNNLEKYILHNDPNAPYPMLITNVNPLIIRTCVKDNVWDQFSYQFSHEYTHLVIRSFKNDKNKYLKWFEETICESMSLFTLIHLSNNWKLCPFYSLNTNYSDSIKKYFENEYKKSGSKLKFCKNHLELKKIDNTCESCREERYDERNFVYKVISNYNEKVKIIFDYTNYISNNDLLIDFDSWVNKYDDEYRDIINEIKKIQPIF
ncbi:MAG: hypothetical protein LBH16_11250 [Treponema sp.]|jgi:hypothetical protein|nr:hypothetical protein [Treponema sp.]